MRLYVHFASFDHRSTTVREVLSQKRPEVETRSQFFATNRERGEWKKSSGLKLKEEANVEERRY